MERVDITIGQLSFDHADYDADNDVLYLHVGAPQEAEGEETPEGHVVRYAPGTSRIVGLTVFGARHALERDGHLVITALPLPITVKRKIRRWVRETQPYRAEHGTELPISDALVVRWFPEISETVHAAETYARLRNQWIETNPEIKGGEPVIRGTRIGVRGIAQRIDDGDTIAILAEDYPHIPAEAFQTAYVYGKAHPRRGRPTRPWRGADEALGRRGPVPVAG